MKIHELYIDESKWTKRAYARNIKGEKVPIEAKDAVCFCLGGAINKCYPPNKQSIIYHKIKLKIKGLGDINDDFFGGVVDWNDATERVFEEVKNLAIELDI